MIRFRRAKTLGVGTPALPVVRLAVAGLLKSGLEEVSDMGAEIHRLMVGENIFFSRRHGRIFRLFIRGLKIRNDVENSLGVFIQRLVGSGRSFREILRGGALRLWRSFCDLSDGLHALFGFRGIRFFLRKADPAAGDKRQQQNDP